jgi:hypothetical protein
MHPFVAVMRRYVIDYLVCQNPWVCTQIMEPDYVLHMGGTDLGPRDEVYVPAVVRQLEQFPGLGMTVHEIILTNDRLAMRFSQHGASKRHNGNQAAWGGIGLYQWNGTRLTSNYAIEDYASRRRQLADGVSDTVEPPAVAPWDVEVGSANLAAESDILEWIRRGAATSGDDQVWFDDVPIGAAAPLLDVQFSVVDDVFSVDGRVAFHVTQHGSYRGGLESIGVAESAVGREATLYSVGVVHRDTNGRLHGRIIRERAAMARALTSA